MFSLRLLAKTRAHWIPFQCMIQLTGPVPEEELCLHSKTPTLSTDYIVTVCLIKSPHFVGHRCGNRCEPVATDSK